jgi:hypothetical protein
MGNLDLLQRQKKALKITHEHLQNDSGGRRIGGAK